MGPGAVEVAVEPCEEAADARSESDGEDAHQREVDVFDLPDGLHDEQQQDVESESEEAGEKESERDAGQEYEQLLGYVLESYAHDEIGLEEGWLAGVGGVGDVEVVVGAAGGHAAALGAVEEAELEEVGLVHVFYGVGVFADGGGEGV